MERIYATLGETVLMLPSPYWFNHPFQFGHHSMLQQQQHHHLLFQHHIPHHHHQFWFDSNFGNGNFDPMATPFYNSPSSSPGGQGCQNPFEEAANGNPAMPESLECERRRKYRCVPFKCEDNCIWFYSARFNFARGALKYRGSV